MTMRCRKVCNVASAALIALTQAPFLLLQAFIRIVRDLICYIYLCDVSFVVCFAVLLCLKTGRLKANVCDLEQGNYKRV